MVIEDVIRKRFFSYVKKTPMCWEWTGHKGLGYGRLKTKRKPPSYYIASRLSYEIHKGEIPKNKFVCHSCDNRGCVNPDHLWIGDAKSNNADRDRKGRINRTFGEKHWLSKYKDTQIIGMRRMNKEGFSDKEIGKAFNAHPNYVRLVIKRKRWPHLP